MSASAKRKISHLKEIENIVAREAKKRFCKAGFVRSYVNENDFRDVLHISIFVENTDLLETKENVDFIGYLQENLENELNEERFPLISYFPKNEEKWFISRREKGFFR